MFKLFDSRVPAKLKNSRTSFVTLPLMHSLTPDHLQASDPCHGRILEGSMDDFTRRRASASVDFAEGMRSSRNKMEEKNEWKDSMEKKKRL